MCQTAMVVNFLAERMAASKRGATNPERLGWAQNGRDMARPIAYTSNIDNRLHFFTWMKLRALISFDFF
jgi:hypothetical protein